MTSVHVLCTRCATHKLPPKKSKKEIKIPSLIVKKKKKKKKKPSFFLKKKKKKKKKK